MYICRVKQLKQIAMKTAIEFLQSNGIIVTPNGNILSDLPEGEEGISLTGELEEATESTYHCYTIVSSQITKIDL